MQLIIAIILVLLTSVSAFAGTCWNGGSSGTNPWTVLDGSGGNPSAAYADINACITNAASGDTINVTKTGSVTWASQLVITKAVKLIGPGKTNITITNSYTCATGAPKLATNNLITFTPDASERTADNLFQISNFTFDGGAKCGIVHIENLAETTTATKIRIDNNEFKNVHTSGKAINVHGIVWGVIATNVFTGSDAGLTVYGTGESSSYDWDSVPYVQGNANTLYIENNTWTITDNGHPFVSTSVSGRWVLRYNTFTGSGDDASWVPFELHGNQSTDDAYSPRGYEAYGNDFIQSTNRTILFSQRGGKGLFFNNRISNSGSINRIQLEEEYPDCASPTVNACVDEEETGNYCGMDGTPQKPNNIYVWNNRITGGGGWQGVYIDPSKTRCNTNTGWSQNTACDVQACWVVENGRCYANLTSHGTTGTVEPTWNTDACGETVTESTGTGVVWADSGAYNGYSTLRENYQYWQQNASYNGTTQIGVYCGTTLPSSCTKGDGAWITSQSCSSLTAGTYGVNPSTLISGTLYKCTATDTWTEFYTPYEYPHPLRGEGGSETTTVSLSGGTVSGGSIQ